MIAFLPGRHDAEPEKGKTSSEERNSHMAKGKDKKKIQDKKKPKKTLKEKRKAKKEKAQASQT